MYARDGFVVVAMTWFLISLLGALPFWISGAIPNYVDCVFETVSGFTTTGASILTDVEALPKGLLYWRSFTHWLGGMGVLVFLLAITRFTAGSGDSMHIMRAESPGPQVNKLVPQTFHSAQIVYMIYIGMTAVQIVLMLLGGVTPFEAVTLTFGTAGTGGFAVRNDGLVSYSPYIQWVVTIFMALFGVNFGIYYLLLQRSVKKALHNEELRMYVIIIVLFSLLIFTNILPSFPGQTWDALRHSCFQVVSIMTTTGYATADFELWPRAEPDAAGGFDDHRCLRRLHGRRHEVFPGASAAQEHEPAGTADAASQHGQARLHGRRGRTAGDHSEHLCFSQRLLPDCDHVRLPDLAGQFYTGNEPDRRSILSEQHRPRSRRGRPHE